MDIEETLGDLPQKMQANIPDMHLKGWFKHQVREALRQTILVKPCNRKDMGGIENCLEYEHTVALLRSKELSNEDQDLLKRILQSNMYTKDRTSHINIGEAITNGGEVTQEKSDSGDNVTHA